MINNIISFSIKNKFIVGLLTLALIGGGLYQEDGQTEWEFTPVEIRTGTTDEGWTEINLLEPLPEGTQVAWNNAYYLIAEMKKSETAHDD